MSQAYTAPNWESSGISASNLQSISNVLEGIVQGTDKAIHALDFNNNNLVVTYVDGTIETFSVEGAKGIAEITKSTSGKVDTYTIVYTDGSTFSFTVRNGDGSSASDIAYNNAESGLDADNVQEAIDEVFISVANGKTLIASAISDKGVETLATDTFLQMSENIRDIPTSGGGTDVSDTTATPGDVLLGKIFHLANGDSAEGELVAPKVSIGHYMSTGQIKTKFECGFRPNYVCLWDDYGNFSIYNKDLSANLSYMCAPTGANQSRELPNTAIRFINELLDDGFYYTTSNSNRNIYWFAIG